MLNVLLMLRKSSKFHNKLFLAICALPFVRSSVHTYISGMKYNKVECLLWIMK